MPSFTSIVLTSLLATSILASPVAQPSTPPTTVSLGTVNYNGNGCVLGGGSVSATWAGATSPIIVTHQRMNPVAGPSIPFSEGRKVCNLLIDLNYPAGYQYSLVDVEWTGFVHLEGSATGTTSAVNRFFGFPGTPITFTNTLTGPLNQNFAVDVPANPADIIWSPCQQGIPLDVVNEIRINGAAAGPGASFFGGSTIGANFASGLKLTLDWRQC